MAGCRLRRPGGVRRGSSQGEGGGVVIRNYSVDIFGGERDKNRGGDRVGEDGGRG